MSSTADASADLNHGGEVQGPPHVHHMTPTNAYHSAKLGMWLFLATELLLFGGLFCAFAVFRYLYFEEFAMASTHLDWRMGAINTVFLIFSSYTAVLAVDAAQHGNNAKVRKNLLITLGCGLVFLVVKYFEYKTKAHIGIFPTDFSYGTLIFIAAFLIVAGFFSISFLTNYKRLLTSIISVVVLVLFYFISDPLAHVHFDLASIIPFGHAEHGSEQYVFNSPDFNKKYQAFFGLYFCMTGLHALHVILGMGLIYWVYIKSTRNRFSENYYTPVEVGALYWHLVDLIWIYLFPLLYLVG